MGVDKPQTMTLDQLIAALESLRAEHGGALPVQTEDDVEPGVSGAHYEPGLDLDGTPYQVPHVMLSRAGPWAPYAAPGTDDE